MKTETVWDGKAVEKRIQALCNLKELMPSVDVEEELKVANTDLERKNRFKESANNSHLFFDVRFGDSFYPVIAVGNYGMAVIGNMDNPEFKNNRRVYEIKCAEDIDKLKGSLFSVWRHYETLVSELGDKPSVADIVGKSYILDFRAFSKSSLWDNIKEVRDAKARNIGTEPASLFTQKQAFDYLSLFPSGVVPSVPIDPGCQWLILSNWKHFLFREG